MITVPVLTVAALVSILIMMSKLIPSYIFYWGDVVALYDRRMAAIKLIFVAIGLGAIASILGGIVLNYFQK
jgi:hypothetical protein